jgi:hypothetical protein
MSFFDREGFQSKQKGETRYSGKFADADEHKKKGVPA